MQEEKERKQLINQETFMLIKEKLQEKNRTFLEVSEKRASDKRGKIYGNLREKMRKKKNYTGHEKNC